MVRFIGTNTASVVLFFNIFTSGIDTIVMPWDKLLFPCVVEVCRLGLEGLHCMSLISVSLSFWKRWCLSDSNFLRCKKRWTTIDNADSMHFALCSGFSYFGTHLAHNFLNNRCSMTILCNEERKIWGKWLLVQLTMNFDRFYALCVQIFTTHRTSQSAGDRIRASTFNLCNDDTVRTQEFR